MKLQRISMANNASLSYINTNKFKTEALGLSLSIPLTPRDYLCNMLLSGIMRRGTESMPSHAAVNRALDMLYAAVVEISSNTCANTLSLNVGADFLADRHVPEGEDVFGGVIGIIGELLTVPKSRTVHFPPIRFEVRLLSFATPCLLSVIIPELMRLCVVESSCTEIIPIIQHLNICLKI